MKTFIIGLVAIFVAALITSVVFAVPMNFSGSLDKPVQTVVVKDCKDVPMNFSGSLSNCEVL